MYRSLWNRVLYTFVNFKNTFEVRFMLKSTSELPLLIYLAHFDVDYLTPKPLPTESLDYIYGIQNLVWHLKISISWNSEIKRLPVVWLLNKKKAQCVCFGWVLDNCIMVSSSKLLFLWFTQNKFLSPRHHKGKGF